MDSRRIPAFAESVPGWLKHSPVCANDGECSTNTSWFVATTAGQSQSKEGARIYQCTAGNPVPVPLRLLSIRGFSKRETMPASGVCVIW